MTKKERERKLKELKKENEKLKLMLSGEASRCAHDRSLSSCGHSCCLSWRHYWPEILPMHERQCLCLMEYSNDFII